MTVKALMELIEAQPLCPVEDETREVRSGYCCDLLSWVMTHGKADMAWITVQTHLNVIAVATLLDMACVIVPEGIQVPQTTLDKAAEESVLILASGKTAFEISGLLFEQGMRA